MYLIRQIAFVWMVITGAAAVVGAAAVLYSLLLASPAIVGLSLFVILTIGAILVLTCVPKDEDQ